MRTPLLATALGCSLVACVDAPPTSATYTPVIGGQITPEGQFPGIGALYMESFQSFSCTGTLIAPDVVLTAAHCLDPAFFGSEVPSFMLAHDTTVTPTPARTTGQTKIPHENFDISSDPGAGPGMWFDIGLIILSEPITSVAPVRLPSVAEGDALATGDDMVLVGYGVTVDGGSDGGIMFDAVTDLVTRGTHELQLSSTGNPQNCFGDSGGPALFDIGGEYRVVGVVSRDASGQGNCHSGGMDTRVDPYLDWINANAPQVCIPGEVGCTNPTPPDAAPPDAAPVPDAEVIDPPDAGGPGVDDDGGGCCSSSGGPGGSVLLALGVGLVLIRRRRR